MDPMTVTMPQTRSVKMTYSYYYLKICVVVLLLAVSSCSAQEEQKQQQQSDGGAAAGTVEEGGGTAAAEAAGGESPNDFGIFDWIHNSPGGYFNPKQEFRYEIPGDSTSTPGIFATQDISKGETLITVPWSLLIISDDPEEDGQMCCGTVAAVAREMKLGSKSKWAPYAQYLNAQSEGQIPSAFSLGGQNLMRQIIGGKSVWDPEIPPSEPTEWLEYDWYKYCDHVANKSDKVSEKAALLVVQRSDDEKMIPGYDMYNHRNGKRWFNTKTITKNGKNHKTTATRDIKAGEQIYISYTHCKECQGRKKNYGTAEIFRDYGFIEHYPQEWWYDDYQFTIDEDPKEEGKLVLKWHSEWMKPNVKVYEQFVTILNRQMKRLRRIRNINQLNTDLIQDIPENELTLLWNFIEANIVAMTTAIEALENEYEKELPLGDDDNDKEEDGDNDDYYNGYEHKVEGTCSNMATGVNNSHYDALEREYDDLDYAPLHTCDSSKYMKFSGYKVLDDLESTYQDILFKHHPGRDDVCMDIENVLQICSSYRPQYHEYSVHAGARYIDDVKRVIFIGGGDSMLLHEALKYPNIELVVGLELDQVVVRKSFKYFQTQPHFDDDRVEWWFGDATKSLLLLPKDYWQSFDLVLVDLSETVMSMSVTNELDVFGALGLLLKPEGVLVKNELYMDEMSEVFDYTQQVYYESPKICSQAMVYASNTVDFFHHKTKDHNVESLFYKPLTSKENHLDYLHDYRKNDARSQGQCEEIPKKDPPTEQQYAAGIIDIVNAEKTTVPIDDGRHVAESIKTAIAAQGFTLLSDPIYKDGDIYCVMKEGYIVARLWPNESYCAFDINLWGNSHKMKDLQAALVETVGSQMVSAYRVVVGGMFGSTSWQEDSMINGPQLIQSRNCDDPPTSTDMATTSEEMISIALEKSMDLAQKSKLKTVVFCGAENKGEGCLAADLLVDYDAVKSVEKVFTCPALLVDDGKEVSDLDMYECEIKTLATLKGFVGNLSRSKFDLLVVDAKVPFRMLQVLHSVFGTIKDRTALIRKVNMFIALSTNPAEEEWRQHFLDRYRKQHQMDPISRAHILLKSGQGSVGFGLVSAGDDELAYNLENYVSTLNDTFQESGKENVLVELQTMVGGDFPYQDDFDPEEFPHDAYDMLPGLAQFGEQKPLGRQNIFQLIPSDPVKGLEMSNTKLNQTLETGVKYLKFKIHSQYEFLDVGEGCVQIFVCEEGSVIGVWDGRNHVGINLFTFEELPGGPEHFIDAIIKFAGNAIVGLRDDQPRGVGRVINFPSDIRPGKSSDTEVDYDDDEEDDDDEEEE